MAQFSLRNGERDQLMGEEGQMEVTPDFDHPDRDPTDDYVVAKVPKGCVLVRIDMETGDDDNKEMVHDAR